MPLSKARQAEYMREHRKRGVIPSVIPKHGPNNHCRLPFCVKCDPEREQEWFKKTFGDYDWLNMAA